MHIPDIPGCDPALLESWRTVDSSKIYNFFDHGVNHAGTYREAGIQAFTNFVLNRAGYSSDKNDVVRLVLGIGGTEHLTQLAACEVPAGTILICESAQLIAEGPDGFDSLPNGAVVIRKKGMYCAVSRDATPLKPSLPLVWVGTKIPTEPDENFFSGTLGKRKSATQVIGHQLPVGVWREDTRKGTPAVRSRKITGIHLAIS